MITKKRKSKWRFGRQIKSSSISKIHHILNMLYAIKYFKVIIKNWTIIRCPAQAKDVNNGIHYILWKIICWKVAYLFLIVIANHENFTRQALAFHVNFLNFKFEKWLWSPEIMLICINYGVIKSIMRRRKGSDWKLLNSSELHQSAGFKHTSNSA